MITLPEAARVSRRNKIIAMLLCLFAVSCGNESERPETVTKLRAIGVEQTPVNAKIGDSVQLTFYLLGKPQTILSTEVLLDTKAPYSKPVQVTPIDSAPVETSVGSLSLYSYRSTMTVAPSPTVSASLAAKGWARLRYQVRFAASGDEENVVGDTIVYPESAPELKWTAPVIEITKPDATGSAGSLDLAGSINSNADETNRVSWYVSSGKVKNRRAKTTVWQDATSGTQTVVMTVRGTKSGAFAIKTKTVTLN